MHVLIAGGAGFLGSHLAEHHLHAGDRVTITDDYSTGSHANVPTGCHTIEANLAAPLHTYTLRDLYRRRFDTIYHLASPASPQHFARDPLGILRCGADATDLLCALADASSARLIYASTSEVYGDPNVHPQPESYTGNVHTTGPRGCYDEAKRYGEALCTAWHRQHQLDVRIARIFNTYGPRMPRDGRLVPAILDALTTGELLDVHGSGLQTRSLCYVSDLIDGLVLLAHSGPEVGPDPVNLGNDEEHTVAYIVGVALSLAGTGRVRHTEPLPHDPVRRCPDLSRARETLRYAPSVPLRDGLRRTLEDAGLYAPSLERPRDDEYQPAGSTASGPSGRGSTERGAGAGDAPHRPRPAS